MSRTGLPGTPEYFLSYVLRGSNEYKHVDLEETDESLAIRDGKRIAAEKRVREFSVMMRGIHSHLIVYRATVEGGKFVDTTPNPSPR